MIVLLALLAACTPPEEEEDSCPVEVDLDPVTACVVPAGASPDAVDMQAEAQLDLVDAIVLDGGTGAPPSGCVDPAAWDGLTSEPDLSGTSTRWLLVEDEAGDRYEVAITHPGPGLDTASLEVLDLRWRWAGFLPFDGRNGELELELRQDGGLVAWVSDQGGTEAMQPPAEVGLSRLEEECRVEVECGVRIDWVVEVEVDGEVATLRGGEQAGLGGYAVALRNDSSIEDLHCSETPSGSAGLAVVLVD